MVKVGGHVLPHDPPPNVAGHLTRSPFRFEAEEARCGGSGGELEGEHESFGVVAVGAEHFGVSGDEDREGLDAHAPVA